MKKCINVLAIASFALALPALAAYPERPIRVVVPYNAGGSTDISARIIGSRVAELMRTSVLIENRGGGGGNVGTVGTVAAKNSEPDGYTFLINGAAMTVLPSMKPGVPFDTLKDFVPVSMAVRGDFTILANPASPFKTFQDVLAYAKVNPGKLSFASSGAWTSAHFMIELLKLKAGIDMTVVHYSGNAPAVAGILSGNPPLGLDAARSANGLVQAGKLRALAVSGASRSSIMPNVPTIAESGVPGFQSGFWLGFFAPVRTPAEAVNRFAAAIEAAVREPGFKEKMAKQGLEGVGNTPAQFAEQLQTEIAQNAIIVQRMRASGTKID